LRRKRRRYNVFVFVANVTVTRESPIQIFQKRFEQRRRRFIVDDDFGKRLLKEKEMLMIRMKGYDVVGRKKKLQWLVMMIVVGGVRKKLFWKAEKWEGEGPYTPFRVGWGA
jgi:hypothetical protein